MVVLVVVSVNHDVLTVGYQVVIYGFDYLDHGITACCSFYLRGCILATAAAAFYMRFIVVSL